MMRILGLWPSRKAGQATEKVIDFNERGGRFTMSRDSAPLRNPLDAVGHCLDDPAALEGLSGAEGLEHLPQESREVIA